jgi:hypothetical protein
MTYPFPTGAVRLGPCEHPRDGMPGTAIRLASGVEVHMSGGVMRSLPRDWRKLQPTPMPATTVVIDASQG